jgi:hypothetical protein
VASHQPQEHMIIDTVKCGHLVYFVAIGYSLWPFGIPMYFVAIGYSLWRLLYFEAICYVFWLFAIFFGHLICFFWLFGIFFPPFCYVFWLFGIFFPRFGMLYKEKSGNPDLNPLPPQCTAIT